MPLPQLADDNLEIRHLAQTESRDFDAFQEELRRQGLSDEPEEPLVLPVREGQAILPTLDTPRSADTERPELVDTDGEADQTFLGFPLQPMAADIEEPPLPRVAGGAAAVPGVQLIGGIARGALVETMQTINILGDWMRQHGIGPRGVLQIDVPDVPRTTRFGGDLERSVGQFLSIFVPTLLGIPNPAALNLASKSRTVVAAATRFELAGMIADFAAFDAHEPRMSDGLKSLPIPLAQPVFEFLASDPEDSKAEGKFKNALEGLLAGKFLEGFFRVGKLIVQSTRIRELFRRSPDPTVREAALSGDDAIDVVPTAPADTAAIRQGDSWLDIPFEQISGDQPFVPRAGPGVPDIEAEFQTVIRNHGGIAPDPRRVPGSVFGQEQERQTLPMFQKFEEMLEGVETAEGFAPGLMASTGKTLEEMLDILVTSGHLAKPDLSEFLAAAERSINLGQPVISNFNTEYLKQALYQDAEIGGAWRTLKTVQDNWGSEARLQRRTATRTEAVGGSRAAARAEAAQLRAGTVSIEPLPPGPVNAAWVREIFPSATLNDAQGVAMVDTMTDTAAGTVQAAARALETGTPTDIAKALGWLQLQGEIDPKRLGVLTEGGRLLSVLNDPTKSYNTYLNQFQDLFGALQPQGMTPRTFFERLTHLNDLAELQQLAVRTANVLEDGRVGVGGAEGTGAGGAGGLKTAGGSRLGAALLNLWTSSILSSPLTQGRNIISTGISTLAAVPERQLATLYQGVPAGEASQLAYGMTAGLLDAAKGAASIMRRGEASPYYRGGPAKFERFTATEELLELQDTNPFIGAIEWTSGLMEKTTGRMLLAADEFFSSFAKRGQMQALAYRRAVVDGGLSGREAAEEVRRQLIAPDARLEEAADAFGLYATFREPLTAENAAFRRLGLASQALIQQLHRFPLGRLIVPFVRTPTKVLGAGLERTPMALMSAEVRNALRRGGPEGAMVMAKMNMGMGIMTLGATMGAMGLITGRGPSNPKMRQQWLTTHQPYSIKLAGEWRSLQQVMEPYALPFFFAADMSQIAGEMLDDNPEELDRLAMASMAVVWNNVASKTYVQGFVRLMDALDTSGPGGTIRNLERLTANIAVGFIPFSGALSAVTRGIDPARRRTEGETFFDTTYRTAMARIPGWSASLPAYRNVWAEELLTEGGWAYRMTSPIYTKDATPHPVDDELMRLAHPISVPPKSLHAGDDMPGFDPPQGTRSSVKLSPEQWDRYIVLQAGIDLEALGGELLRVAVGKLMASPGYDNLPEGMKRAEIRDIVYNTKFGYRPLAREQLLREFPELEQNIREKQRELQLLGTRETEEQDNIQQRRLQEFLQREETPRTIQGSSDAQERILEAVIGGTP